MESLKIMVIHKDLLPAIEIKKSLESLNYNVCSLVNKLSNIYQSAIISHPNIILLTIFPDAIDESIQAALQIRKDLNIPIIFLDAFFDDYSLQKAKIAEPAGFLTLPVEERELYNLIETVIYKTSVSQENKAELLQYKELLNTINSGIIVMERPSGTESFFIINYNQTAEKIDKMSKKSVIGKNITDAFPYIIDFGLIDVLKRVFNTGEAEHFPIRFYHNHKVSGWRENYIYKMSNNQLVIVFDDYTKQKQYEEELIKKYKQYESTFMSIALGLIILNTEGQVLSINSKAREIFDISENSSLYYDSPVFSLTEIKSKNSDKKCLPFKIVYENKQEYINNYRIQTSNGELKKITLTGTHQIINNGWKEEIILIIIKEI